jgi:cleavage and polyadenylation specificity factor subunit 4
VLPCRYRMGFCPNGPTCRYKHLKLPGPPPPVEEVLQKILQFRSFNRFGQHRNNYNQQADRPHPPPQGSGLPSQNPTDSATAPVEAAGVQQAQTMNQQTPQQQQKPNATDQVQAVSNGLSNQATRVATPLPQGPSRCVWSF